MEDKKAQGSTDINDIKKRLIEEAAQEIANIQITGQMLRSQIDAAKDQMLNAIEAEDKLKQAEDAIMEAKRSELVKRLGEAAKSGNLSEMQRIRNFLSEEKI